MSYEILKDYGLTDREAKIYFAAISIGTASIAQLAKKAGLKRPSVYPVVDELLEKNLLIVVPKGKNKFYKAENPKELIIKMEEQECRLAAAIPFLEDIYQKNLKQPKVRFYEGHNQLLKMYEEIYRSKEIWTITSDEFFDVFSNEERKHMFRVLIRGEGFLYELMEDTSKSREGIKAKYRTGVVETRFLPKDMDMNTDIYVYENKVAQVSLEHFMGAIVEDQDIAKTQKEIIEFIWQRTK